MGEDEEVVYEGNAGYVPSPSGYSLWDLVYTFLGGFVAGALGTLMFNNYIEALEEQQFIEEMRSLKATAVQERASVAPQETVQP